MKLYRDNCAISALDGVIALSIATGLIQPALLSVSLPSHSPHLMRFSDAAFALVFILSWQYCFSILHLYDLFAVIPSRLRRICKGVFVMITLLATYIYAVHRSVFSLQRLALAAICLCAYVVGRLMVASYMSRRTAEKDPKRVLILGSGP